MNISSEWTQSERLALVEKISEKLTALDNNFPVPGKKVYSLGEALYFLSTAPSDFLEQNRIKFVELEVL